jgi:hypothetical protein
MGRSTLIMVVLFLLLAGGAYALETVKPREPENPTTYVLDVKDTDVQRLDVTTEAGTTAFDRADPFGWKFANGGEPADLSRVSSVVNRLAKLRSSAKVTDNPTDLAAYGLDRPRDTATLTMKDGTTNRVIIGAKTVNDAAYYAMVDGKPTLHTINTLLVGDIDKLVTEPPVPTPAAGAAAPTATAGTASSAPEETPEATGVPTPTIGLPALTTE